MKKTPQSKYLELCEYIPNTKSRARTLGVQAKTIEKLDQGALDISQHLAAKIDLMSWTAQELFAIVSSKLLMEHLLLDRQPMFDEVVPAEGIRSYGFGFAQMYVDAVKSVQEIKLQNLRKVCADTELWQLMAGDLSEDAKERREKSIKAIKEMRGKHGKISLLD